MDHRRALADLLADLAHRPPRFGLGFRSRTRAGWDVGWHHHDLPELVYHHRGRGQVQVEDGPLVPYAAGDLDLHAPHRRHRQPGERDGEDWCLHVVLPCRWPADLPPLIHLPAAVRPVAVTDLADLTAHPGAALPTAAALARDLRAGALLVDALAAFERGAGPVATTTDHATRCQELIDQRFAGIGRIDEVAHDLGISPDRLRHCFTARHGLGPRAYLRQVRLRAAQRLLAETPLTLHEIAARCGIGNARQLCDLFRELGCPTPGAWRAGARA